MNIKNDQTAKADAGKAMLTLVPRKIIWAIAKIREYGCKKYASGGEGNWKKVEVERYRDAMYRHWLAYLDDPHGVDHESGLPILWHCACNLALLIELEDDAFSKIDAEKVEAKSLYGKCDGCKYENLEDSPCLECGREFPDKYERSK